MACAADKVVLLGGFLSRKCWVGSVIPGLPADEADAYLVLLTEKFQGLPMFCAYPVSCSWMYVQPFHCLHHILQLPVWLEVSPEKKSSCTEGRISFWWILPSTG